MDEIEQLRRWVKARGLNDKGYVTQRSLAKAVGINEGTLSGWKKLGAPLESVQALKKWMTDHRRKGKHSGNRGRAGTPLCKVAKAAGITYGTLFRLREQGAPTSDSVELRKWLDRRKEQQATSQKAVAAKLDVSADTLRRWGRQGAPVHDETLCREWYARRLQTQRERNQRAKLRRIVTRRVRARFIKYVNQGRKNKFQSVSSLVGCTQEKLLQHIESLFADGMSWVNRHLWHIDHIIPCSAFNLVSLADQRKCFHFTNLQPMWAIDNMIKRTSLEWKRSV